MKKSVFLALLLSLTFFSCKKEKEPADEKKSKTYCVGYVLEQSTGAYPKAVFWDQGKQTILSSDYSVANKIAVINNDIYITGHLKFQAVYWKNGVVNVLPTADNIGATAGDIFFYKGDIYITGSDLGTLIVWKNGVKFKTFGTSRDSITYGGLSMNNEDCYYLSMEKKNGRSFCACYKNETPTPIGKENDWVSSVKVAGEDVYVAGFNSSRTEVYLWKNNIRTIIARSADSIKTTLASRNIESEGGNLYVFYYETDVSTKVITYKCWKNGTEYPVTNAKDFLPVFIKPVGNKICQGGRLLKGLGLNGAAAYIDQDQYKLEKDDDCLVSDIAILQ